MFQRRKIPNCNSTRGVASMMLDHVTHYGCGLIQYCPRELFVLSFNPPTPDDVQRFSTSDWEREIKRSVLNYAYIPECKQTEELSWLALHNSPTGWIIAFISKPTKEMREYALRLNGINIEEIANPSDDEKMMALQNNIEAIRHIDHPTDEMVKLVIDKDCDLLHHIEHHSDEVCLYLLSLDGAAEKSMNLNTTSPQILLKILAINPGYIWKVRKPTEEMCLTAVKLNGNLLQAIAEEYQTDAVCLAAVNNDRKAIVHIKDDDQRRRLCPPLVKVSAPDSWCCVCRDNCDTETFMCHHFLCAECYKGLNTNPIGDEFSSVKRRCPYCREVLE